MRIWAEVYNPAGVMVGIVNLEEVSVRRRLDAAGEIVIEVAATDPAANEFLQIRRRVKVYQSQQYGKRLIGAGILLQRNFSDSAGNKRLAWNCTDNMELLRNESTGRGLIFDNVPIRDVVAALVGRVGWNVIANGVAGSTSQRFDAQNLLQALTEIATRHGYHFRLDADNTLEFGAMGETSGVRIVQAASGQVSGGDVALIDRLEIVQDGYEILNHIEPIAGPVDGGLTLKRSTMNAPYQIQVESGPNGQAIYALTDAASVEKYGKVSAVVSPKQLIVPVEPSQTALINAANVLYDWAATFLRRHREPQYSYQISAVKVDRAIRVGDKVRLTYKGEVYQRGIAVRFADVDEDLWVLEVSENYSLQGVRVDLTVSNIDEHALNAVDLLVDNITARTIQNMGVEMNVDRSEETSTVSVDKLTPALVNFTVRQTTVEVGSCRLTVERDNPAVQVLTIFLDDIEVSGGPWFWGGAASDVFTIEIADIINEAAVLAGEHELRFECLYGSGDLDVTINLVEAIVPGISVPPNPYLGREFKKINPTF